MENNKIMLKAVVSVITLLNEIEYNNKKKIKNNPYPVGTLFLL